jgi:hypothetical protein
MPNQRMDKGRVTFHRPPASPTGQDGRTSTVGLPPDLLEKSRGRVKLVALLILCAALLGMA